VEETTMSLAYWCVLVAALHPYVFAGIAKWSFDFDNRAPREYLSRVSGIRQRAHWVQLNAFESFPFFAAAVLIAHQTGAPQGRIDTLAVLFVVLRLLYGASYLADLAALRSVLWIAATAVCVALFF
jgi:uncharacterized MAPEG superfamily protein